MRNESRWNPRTRSSDRTRNSSDSSPKPRSVAAAAVVEWMRLHYCLAVVVAAVAVVVPAVRADGEARFDSDRRGDKLCIPAPFLDDSAAEF